MCFATCNQCTMYTTDTLIQVVQMLCFYFLNIKKNSRDHLTKFATTCSPYMLFFALLSHGSAISGMLRPLLCSCCRALAAAALSSTASGARGDTFSVRMQETIVTLWELQTADIFPKSGFLWYSYCVSSVFFICLFCFYCLFVVHQRSRKPSCARQARQAASLLLSAASSCAPSDRPGRTTCHHHPLHISTDHKDQQTKDQKHATLAIEALSCSCQVSGQGLPPQRPGPDLALIQASGPSAKMANIRKTMFEPKPGTTFVNKHSSTPQLNISHNFLNFPQSTGDHRAVFLDVWERPAPQRPKERC